MRLIIILIFISLAGCSKAPITAKLEMLDSLVMTNADSAYKVIEKIDHASLTTKEAKAHYALLHTQATYRNYMPITFMNDSLVDIAVSYYEKEPQDIRYSRSLMYKGAVLAELGRDREAMEHYKMAEQYADTSDYLNMGLINMRLGDLYVNNLTTYYEPIHRYTKALRYLNKVNSTRHIGYCNCKLGALYLIENRDSSFIYLNRAIDISREEKDSVSLYIAYEISTHVHLKNKDHRNAINTALQAIKYNINNDLGSKVYNILTRSYAAINMADSAYFYNSLIPEPENPLDSLSNYINNTVLAKLSKDYESAYKYMNKWKKQADNIRTNSEKKKLQQLEADYNTKYLKAKNDSLELKQKNQRLIIAIIALILFYVVWHFLQTIKRQKKQLAERIEDTRNILKELKSLEHELNNHKNKKLTQFTDNWIETIQKLGDTYQRHAESPAVFLSEFDKILKGSRTNSGIFHNIVEYTNTRYENIISKIEDEYPQLNSDDLRIIAMVCCGFSAAVIAINMGYKNERSVYTRKSRIATKMNIDTSLDSQISTYIT